MDALVATRVLEGDEVPAELPVSIDALAAGIAAQLDPVEIDPVHRFARGLYAREIMIPAGTLLVGKRHRTQHLNVISAGRIRVWAEGESVREIVAPFAFVAEPGTQRVGFTLEDTIWTTVHATTETDLEKLEAELIDPGEYPLLDSVREALCPGY